MAVDWQCDGSGSVRVVGQEGGTRAVSSSQPSDPPALGEVRKQIQQFPENPV